MTTNHPQWARNLFLASAALLPPPAALHAADLAPVRRALMEGRVDQVTSMLQQASPKDPDAQSLLCRAWFAQESPDEAVRACETSAAARNDSNAQMWLGRAYGLKASHSGVISAYQIAKRVKVAFESAVTLDPANLHAVGDLGQFYVDAPGFLGGGADRVHELATKVMPRNAALGHRLNGLALELDGKMADAEAELQRAAQPRTPESLIDLALFYQRRGDKDKTEATVRAAVAADTAHGPALLDAANILITIKRAPDLAEKCLRDYLASPNKTDEAPAFRADVVLAKLLEKRGDKVGAQRQYSAALALASKYEPALKGVRQ